MPGNGATLTRLAVRAIVTGSAGIMAAGFLGWRAGALVAALTALTFVLVGTVPASLRIPAPFGRARLLRELRRGGYRILPDSPGCYVAVGPGGAYLLDTRAWVHQVSHGPGDWRIGARPASRAVGRVVERVGQLKRSLELATSTPVPSVVPVIMVVGRIPDPVMRAGNAIIARPRSAVAHLLNQPAVLDTAQVTALCDALEGGESF